MTLIRGDNVDYSDADEWESFVRSGQPDGRSSARNGLQRIGHLVLLLPVVLLGIHFASRWARFVGAISGHRQVPAIIWGAAFGAIAMGGVFVPLVVRSRRGRIAAGFGVGLFAWLISTQPYSRTNENVPLAHLYDRVAPDYVWGLVVSMGVTLVCGMLVVGWWVLRLRRALKAHRQS